MQPSNKLPPWLKPKVEPAKVKLSVAWYTAAEWRKVKEASVDSDRFEETYDEWQEMAEKAILDMKVIGLTVEKYAISADDLLAWCILYGKSNDASARAQYVSAQSARLGGVDE